jgi:hypothetical protein
MQVNGENVIAVEWRDKEIRRVVTAQKSYLCYQRKDCKLLIDFLEEFDDPIDYQYWVKHEEIDTFPDGIEVSESAQQIYLSDSEIAALDPLIADEALIEGSIEYCRACDDYQGIEMSLYHSPCRHLQWVDIGFWGGCGGEESDQIYAESFKSLVREIKDDPYFESVHDLIIWLNKRHIWPYLDEYMDREGCEPACRYLKSLKGTPTPGAVHWNKAVKWVRKGNHD